MVFRLEEALDKAWKTELPKARHLRCVKHFETNCKQKLHAIGIKEGSQQKFFLEKVFGVVNKTHGIVDTEDKDDVKRRLEKCRIDLDDRETHLLQKKEGYVPQFSKYLADRQEMIGKSMTLKARRKAHMSSSDNVVQCWLLTNMLAGLRSLWAIPLE